MNRRDAERTEDFAQESQGDLALITGHGSPSLLPPINADTRRYNVKLNREGRRGHKGKEKLHHKGRGGLQKNPKIRDREGSAKRGISETFRSCCQSSEMKPMRRLGFGAAGAASSRIALIMRDLRTRNERHANVTNLYTFGERWRVSIIRARPL